MTDKIYSIKDLAYYMGVTEIRVDELLFEADMQEQEQDGEGWILTLLGTEYGQYYNGRINWTRGVCDFI